MDSWDTISWHTESNDIMTRQKSTQFYAPPFVKDQSLCGLFDIHNILKKTHIPPMLTRSLTDNEDDDEEEIKVMHDGEKARKRKRNLKVRFAETLVAEVRLFPRVPPEEIHKLFYGQDELLMFKHNAACGFDELDFLALPSFIFSLFLLLMISGCVTITIVRCISIFTPQSLGIEISISEIENTMMLFISMMKQG